MLPARVREEVEAQFGPVRAARAVGGGCLNSSLRLEVRNGAVFLKYNSAAPAGMFGQEAEGLRALRATASGLRIPEVLAVRDGAGDGWRWLALEWLEPGRRTAGGGERLGRGLAALHRSEARGWGWERDGFLGPLPQVNRPTGDWAGFWSRHRLEPQLARAREAGLQPGKSGEWELLLSHLPNLLTAAEMDGPSLLHGDLWSGNVLALSTGEPALVDPAVYRGHREVDLAMSELFGGFEGSFYSAYREAWPLQPGYEEVRRGVYQLYYLLVHVNLFGTGYVAQTTALLRRVLATL